MTDLQEFKSLLIQLSVMICQALLNQKPEASESETDFEQLNLN
jgi:hypothetical protein